MCFAAKYAPPWWRTGGRWLAFLAGGFALAAHGDTIAVTNTNLSGPGSFKQAIITANTNPGPNTIVFNISGTPPFTIAPTNALDAITAPVVIDATTQPGFAGTPVVELNGAATGGGTVGLRFSSGASRLRGLAINRFPVQLIQLDSASNTIQGNFIGTDVTGTQARGKGSGSYGILVESPGNLIGGTNAGNGNVIAGGNDTGIYLLTASNNIVQGNLIGLGATGGTSLSNLFNGIAVYNSGGNLIGGPAPAAGNIISGNGASGVYLTGTASTGNVIQGNRIGTDSSGSNAVGNATGDGITIISAPGNLVVSNLISGNALAGVSIQSATGNQVLGNFIGCDVNGNLALTNRNSGVSISGGSGNQIGGTDAGAGNVISGNKLDGITLTGGTSANVIQGNLIGVTAAGTALLRNLQDGITISGATSNLIGGVVAGARNVISGNASNGLDIVLLADSGNCVQGNYIGTDVTGIQPIANRLAGVLVHGSSNFIGGTVTGAGNVISGNTHQGVWISGSGGNVKGNVIQGNFIGLNAAGNGLGNGIGASDPASAGIAISAAAGNVVGGTTPGAGNVISGNAGAGVFLVGVVNTAFSNRVQGNFIGTDPSGALPIGNLWEGIYVEQAATNQIGGSTVGAGNLISGNYSDGILLTNAAWNVVQGNFIGTKADGTNNLANQYHNVELQLNAANNVIGGTAAGAGNRLAYASMNASQMYCGVRVRTGAANNLISGNSIFSNGALGIDLSPTDALSNNAGVNPIVGCESTVAASAANAGQNFPTLSTVYSGTLTRVRGSLNSKTGRTYTLQFFASPAGDASGYGEGQVFLGQTNLILSSSCSANFTAYLPATVPPGWVVTATATDPANNTSEFSAWVSVIPVPPLVLNLPGPGQLALSWTNNGGSFALQQTSSLMPPVTWTAVTNPPVLQNNFMVATLGMPGTNVFYRLLAP
jgi:parallel beta-helix repeat protein